MGKDTAYYTKIIQKIIILFLILGGLFLTYKVAMFYIPFIIAMIVSACVEPLIKIFMKRTKMKRKMASIISLVLVVILLVSVVFFASSKIITEVTKLLSNINIYFDEILKWGMGALEYAEEINNEIPEEVTQIVQNSLIGSVDVLKNWAINLLTKTINTITSIPTMITYGFITILAIIFICFDKEYIPNTIKSQIPKSWFEKIKQILKETCSVSVKYIKAEAKLSLICFILITIGLVFVNLIGIKVEYLFIMAILIGIVDLLPLFGAGAVMVPWAVYLLIVGNIPLAIAVMVIWGIWAVLKQLIEPKMVSKEMGLHPIYTLVGMYTGFKLMGVLGLIVGPIIFLMIKNIFSELIEKGVLKSFFELE